MSIDWADLRRRSLQPGGFANDRQHIWPRLLNVDPKGSSIAPSSSSAPEPHRDEFQIQLDTARSFVLYPHNTSDSQRIRLQKDLHRLIVALFRKRPKLNYFQGYHDIATVVFLTLPEELQSSCLENLSLHRLRDSMGVGLEPVLGLLGVTKKLIELADPDMSAMLNQSAQLPFFALSNLLTLFSHDMPSLPLIQHVFDYLLCRPPVAAVYLATAIILARREEVRRLQEENEDGMIHSLLSSLPNLVDDIELPPLFESENQSEASDNSLSSRHDGIPHSLADGGTTNSVLLSDADTTLVADPPSPGSGPTTDSVNTRLEMESEGISFSSLPESDFTLVEPAATDAVEVDKGTLFSKDVTTPVKLVEEHTRYDKRPSTPDAITTSLPVSRSPTPSPPPALLHLSPSPSSLVPPSSPLLLPVQRDLPTPSPMPSSPSFTRPPSEPPSPSPLPSPSPSPRPSTSPSPPPSNSLTLTSLLSHADKLYELYPPTHPQLSLSLIMGPQSTVYTWSERFRDWPSDDEAEIMVIRPDLVVYPYDPHGENSSNSSSDESSVTESNEEDEKRDKEGRATRRKKLNKSSKQYEKHQEKQQKKDKRENKRKNKKEKKLKKKLGSVRSKLEEKRAMLAGAVVVLGIAMAMYGVRTGSSSGGSGGRFGFGGSGIGGGRHWPWS
ncbi:hypothetical protein AGABI2DRAFT_120352 [Agaricus bisporus var. bisporus H97]|uniref:hypothetical protein n=1 Tax=Agaricus bisporus var. bisporus (strain H97 / ATCC MYA-4626 / FGSC 10389) TaxID=936046 RepID=UPI00029F5430|nr:hypothetical protein AGABI2DRAFT_120352 [Agaricus bisporus var. bisporus H97]EKV45396.1 hypothetical protein AGABI2DRAFT_120352 [Agaricus bisporus var. bisporus H97]